VASSRQVSQRANNVNGATPWLSDTMVHVRSGDAALEKRALGRGMGPGAPFGGVESTAHTFDLVPGREHELHDPIIQAKIEIVMLGMLWVAWLLEEKRIQLENS
jgi:hypothetical protein